MMDSFPTGVGSEALGGPMEFDSYKRAVYRPPPTKFYVDMLPPLKQSGSYSYGLRITPANAGDQDSFSEASFSTRSSNIDVVYDVWRRWDDCLWFQEMLEQTYSRLAREKRQRLQAGKGVKKNGMYLQDQASSWESLPPGPDPNDVAKDIHDLIPKLTKKGTLFRASQATVDQRYKELTALMEALFDFEVPTLIKDLRADRQVTDFFGYWRRDHDFFLKEQSRIEKPPRSSTASTVSSLYSHSSATSAASAATASSTVSEAESIPYSVSAYTPELPSSLYPASTHSSSHRGRGAMTPSNLSQHALSLVSWHRSRKSHSRTSVASSNSSSSSNDSKGSEISTPCSEAVSSVFDSDRRSQYLSEYSFYESGPGLGSVDEDGTGFDRDGSRYSQFLSPAQGKPGDRRSRRAIQIYSPPSASDRSSTGSTLSGGIRDSWATTSTVTGLLDGLNITLPEEDEDPNTPSRLRHRDSTSTIQTCRTTRSAANHYASALDSSFLMPSDNRGNGASRSRESVATFMTTDSADAIIPRDDAVYMPAQRPRDSIASLATFRTTDSAEAVVPLQRRGGMRRSVSNEPSRTPSARSVRTMSVMSEDDAFSFESCLDEFPMTLGTSAEDSPESRPSTPIARLSTLPLPRPLSTASIVPALPAFPLPLPVKGRARSSTTSSIVSSNSSSSTSSTSSNGHTISIKAAYKESIILLRVPRSITYDEVREKIRIKFSQQEGVELSESFFVGYLPRQPASPTPSATGGRARSTSVTSTVSSDYLEIVTTQRGWEYVTVLGAGGKLTLKIFDPRHN